MSAVSSDQPYALSLQSGSLGSGFRCLTQGLEVWDVDVLHDAPSWRIEVAEWLHCRHGAWSSAAAYEADASSANTVRQTVRICILSIDISMPSPRAASFLHSSLFLCSGAPPCIFLQPHSGFVGD